MVSDLLQILKIKLLNQLRKSIDLIDPQYLSVGFFGLINFTLILYLDARANPIIELNLLHWIGLLLCTVLILSDIMPVISDKYRTIFWYVVVLYCLPFYSIMLLVFSYASSVSLLNFGLSLFLLLVITDWFGFLILFMLGILFSLILCYFTYQPAARLDYYLVGYYFLQRYDVFTLIFIWATITSVIFSRNIAKNKERQELMKQLYMMQTMAGSIAHEIRTPLITILASIKGSNRFLPKLIKYYESTSNNSKQALDIQNRYLEALKTSSEIAISEIHAVNVLITMSLVKLDQKMIGYGQLQGCSMHHCIDTALNRYPFRPKNQRQLVCYCEGNDFKFNGIALLMVHVIFNLLKNALYYIEQAGKGDILIWLEQSINANQLHFKDTGSGIDAKILPYIFDQFFSKSPAGTGIGLAFCKMVMQRFAGRIDCFSEKGQYTEFILSFPHTVEV